MTMTSKHFSINKAVIIIVSIFTALFQYSYFHVVLSGIVPQLILFTVIIPLFIYSKKIYELIEKDLSNEIKIGRMIINVVIIILISLITVKSFNLELIKPSKSILSVPSNIGLLLLGFQNVYIIIIALKSINFKSKADKHNKFNIFLYALPSLLFLGLLYLVYFPAQVSADSVYIWKRIGINLFDDAHPIMYELLLKGLSLIWNNIAIVSLFQILLCSFTFSYIASELEKMSVPPWLCWIVAIILPIIPTNALYSVTIWKDVPYTMGLLILSMLLLKSVSSNFYSEKGAFIQIFIVSLFTLFMRHNAIFSIFIPLFVFGVYWIIKNHKKFIIKTLILGFVLLIAFFGIKQVTISLISKNFNNKSVLNLSWPKTIQTQQIIYTQNQNSTRFTPMENELFSEFILVDQLNEYKKEYADLDIWMYYHKPNLTVNYDYISKHEDEFRKYYLDLLKNYPKDMLIGYQKITSIMWATTEYGPTAYRGIAQSEYDGYVISQQSKIPGLVWILDEYLFRFRFGNTLSVILWRPALAFILMLLFMYVSNKKHGIGPICLALPVLANQLTYFIIIASQDTRYSYINYSMMLIMLALSISKLNAPILKTLPNQIQLENEKLD